METGKLNCSTNQLTGFYIIIKLDVIELIKTYAVYQRDGERNFCEFPTG